MLDLGDMLGHFLEIGMRSGCVECSIGLEVERQVDRETGLRERECRELGAQKIPMGDPAVGEGVWGDRHLGRISWHI